MHVRGILWLTIVGVSYGALSASCQTLVPAWPSAVERAARAAPEARIVVLDIASGHLLAAHQSDDASRTLAAPRATGNSWSRAIGWRAHIRWLRPSMPARL